MLALLRATFPDATSVDLTQSAIDLCEALRPLTRELEQTKAANHHLRDRGAALWSRHNSCSLDPLKEHELEAQVYLPGDEPQSHVSSTGDYQYKPSCDV